ncbi:MAG: DUF4416 family protein [Caldimicrobium sp.]|nr:DUF4416 family protein [Caldimicrobium sp.]
MSHPKNPKPVLYFMAVAEKEKGVFLSIARSFEGDLGMIVLQGTPFDFSSFTTYYNEEMGKPIWKNFYFFEKLREPEFLPELKHRCYQVERVTALPEGNRTVNIDPGYLNLAKVVLSTFKDYAHRIYLGNSVYAEVTLIYKERCFQSLPWTYPDYKTPQTLEIFNKARVYYKKRIHAYR